MISALVPEVPLKCAAIKFDHEVDDKVLAGSGTGCILFIISNHIIIVDRLPLLKLCNCILVAFSFVFVTISRHRLFGGTNSHITQHPLFVLFLAILAFESCICATNLQPVFIGRILQPGLIKESLFRNFLFPKMKKFNMI